jgi:hypothetical protein
LSDTKRLWRLRKLHDTVDAELRELPDGAIEVQFFYNGSFSYARRVPTRSEAIGEARSKRAELERQGWNFHW